MDCTGGSCDSDPNRPYNPNVTLLPIDVMNPVVVWLASDLSNGMTGGRYVGKFWDDGMAPDEAARRCLEEPVLRTPAAKR